MGTRRLRERTKRERPLKEKRPSKEILAAVRRALSSWPKRYGKPFQRTKKTVRELAEDQEITTEKCEVILDYIKRAE